MIQRMDFFQLSASFLYTGEQFFKLIKFYSENKKKSKTHEMKNYNHGQKKNKQYW